MTSQERSRLKRLCYLSKRGFADGFSLDDVNFCHRLLKKFPDEYRKIQCEASDQAVSELQPNL